MGMDTWYDLQLQELAELTDRVSDLLGEVQGSGVAGAPQLAPRVRKPFDRTDSVTDPLKEVRRDE